MTEDPRPTILIVDDEESILRSLQRLLRREFNVLTAQSAAEGLDLLRQHEVQVILTDQRMPGMGGTEMLARVKGQYPDAIRMLLTGYADIDSVIEGINAGEIARYLVKPWNPVELLAALREATEKYRLRVDNRRLIGDLQAANAELERRVAERTAELAAANDHLRELNRLKDDVLAIASHDLRTPLAGIIIAAELLEGDTGDLQAHEQVDLLRTIGETASNLIALVSATLDVAKIEAGKLALNLDDVRAGEVARQVTATLSSSATAKGIRITYAIAPDEPVLRADRLRLSQICANLLGNAIKFTSRGGTIKVSVERALDGVHLTISDSGVGIPPEDMPRLFERFQQGGVRATAAEPGTGLGLAITRQMVELHGGRIEVVSERGQGSAFTVFLPLSPQPDTDATTPATRDDDP